MPTHISSPWRHSYHTVIGRQIVCGANCACKPVSTLPKPHMFCFNLADTRFEWDLSLAIVLPVAMAMSIALSVDPRVIPSAAGPGTSATLGSSYYRTDADAAGGLRRCELPAWAARDSFPCGASMFVRVRVWALCDACRGRGPGALDARTRTCCYDRGNVLPCC